MKRIIIGLCVLFSVASVSAQGWEIGVLGGVSNYTGDLSPSNSWYSLGPSHAAFGGFVRYNPHRLISGRFGVNYSTVSASDTKAQDGGRLARNLSFKSSILEFNLIGEWNLFGYQPYNLAEVFSPYLFGGIAAFVFNPQAELDGVYYDLQPLGTEGQGLAAYPERQYYRLTEIAIPLGGGIKYAVNDHWNIGLEVGMRKTFTDYLDDVSTTYVNDGDILEERGEIALALANRTGTPKSLNDARGSAVSGDVADDWYLTAGLTISYNFLDNGLVGSRNRGRKGKNGCPSNF